MKCLLELIAGFPELVLEVWVDWPGDLCCWFKSVFEGALEEGLAIGSMVGNPDRFTTGRNSATNE